MADDVPIKDANDATVNVATDDIGGGRQAQIVKLAEGVDGSDELITPLTDAQLRDSPVPVSGTVAVSGTLPVSGPLTDVQLRATPVPVSGTVTASGPLTDAQLRASDVQVEEQNSAAILSELQGTVEVALATVPTHAVTQSGTWTVQPGNTANTTAWKVDGSAVTQPVSLAAAVPVTDNSGSLTVDAPVGTPVFVRLSDGSSAITTLPVSIGGTVAVTQSGTWDEIGINDSGNSITVDSLALPVKIVDHVSTSETLTANTVPNSGNGRTLTPSGFTAVELEVSNINGAATIYGTLDGSTPSSTNFAFVLPATPCVVTLPCNAAVTVKVISGGTPIVGYTLRGD